MRSKRIRRRKRGSFSLVPDPKYFVPYGVVTSRAALEHRDASKSGGG